MIEVLQSLETLCETRSASYYYPACPNFEMVYCSCEIVVSGLKEACGYHIGIVRRVKHLCLVARYV